jgi:hypothetical protein
MFEDWNNNNVDNNPEYHLSYFLAQERKNGKQRRGNKGQ